MLFIRKNITGTYISFGSTKVFFLLLIVLFFIPGLFSCKNGNKHNNDSLTENAAGIIKLPEPVKISQAELTRINSQARAWYDTVLENSGFNGAMLVAKQGNIVFEQYRGVVKLGSTDSITPQTVFHIASVSKTITAMATLKLWEEGKLGLDDLYSKYFPSFNYTGITIRNLLSHRSGLPNYLYFMEKLWPNRKVHIRNQDVFDYLVTYKDKMENVGTPNTRFTYCNTNYALLALLVEKITKEDFPDFIKKTFFVPLQMNNSFVYKPTDSTGLPPNYDWRSREIPLMFLDDVYGDKNVYTTVRDLYKWDRGLTPGLIFKKETLDEAFKPYSNERPGIKNYGLGWRMDIFPNGKKMIFHNGWWHGNNAAFIRLLDEDATIILVNSRYTSATYKAKNLINIFGNYFDKSVEDDNESSNGSRNTTLNSSH